MSKASNVTALAYTDHPCDTGQGGILWERKVQSPFGMKARRVEHNLEFLLEKVRSEKKVLR